jgi:hypothetical protein
MALAIEKSRENLPSVLPAERAAAFFAHEAERLAGMSAEEFLRKWDAGEFRDLDETPEGRNIAYLALLIPFGRRNP